MEQIINELFDFYLWCYYKDIRPYIHDKDMYVRVIGDPNVWPYGKTLTKTEVYARYFYEHIKLHSINDIKKAVDDGYKVCWSNEGYRVLKDKNGEYNIVYLHNQHTTGLTNKAGTILNGDINQFFIVYD